MALRVSFGEGVEFRLDLREDGTPTVAALLKSVPFASKVMRWGDEIYFEAPFHTMVERDAKQEMGIGEVAYWPDGNALAIFFGRTPASTGNQPRAYSPCNIVGTIRADPPMLRSVRPGTRVEVKSD